MVKDAEQHASDDAKRREGVEMKNKADATAYETEKFLKEHGAKIDPAKKAAVEAAIEKVKAAAKDGDAAAIKAAIDALNTEMQAVSSGTLFASQELAPAKTARRRATAGRRAPRPVRRRRRKKRRGQQGWRRRQRDRCGL